MLLNSEQEVKPPVAPNEPKSAARRSTALEFYNATTAREPGYVQGIVTHSSAGSGPNYHHWSKGHDCAQFLAEKSAGVLGAYHTIAAYDSSKVTVTRGRSFENAMYLRTFQIDIEGSAEKYEKHGADHGYLGEEAIRKVVAAFQKRTGLRANFYVLTGSGGVHLYFVLDEAVTRDVWVKYARALVALCAKYDLKIDTGASQNAAGIMRSPGSRHFNAKGTGTGSEVVAYALREDPYSLEEFGVLVGYDANAVEPLPAMRPVMARADSINVTDVLNSQHQPYSYKLAAQRCGAMRKAAEANGRATSEPVWMLAIGVAARSIEGEDYAHEISSGYGDYDYGETDKKIAARKGGPAGCDAWANAYGTGGPCDTCELRTTVKNPAVQLGTATDTTEPGAVGIEGGDAVAPWVAELNVRYALVRTGSKMMVADFQTYSTAGRGIGWLDVAAFRLTLNGRMAPVESDKEKPQPLAAAYLAHPQRKQYEGLAFAPGETLPPGVLNMWQGFAVEPVEGDVSLWLEVLNALVPKKSDWLYVLRWIAWKIQNPGGVPDTILIFKGAKGTGKNSLFDPLIELFGRHAMLADAPELFAGQFTWHLMALSLAILDEAVFIGDPKQADRIKSRVTAKTMMYEQKGMDPVQGVNRCAYVMLTNHEYVWQATNDERRAVVIEVGEVLRGNLEFWGRYHAWVAGAGPAALLHYLQEVDLTGFNPRDIPRGDALRRQAELTALRTPAVAWWHQCLTEGEVRWRDNLGERVAQLSEDGETEIDRAHLRLSFEQSAAARGRVGVDWPGAAKRLRGWCGPEGMRQVRARVGTVRGWRDVLPPLGTLREAFTLATQVEVSE
jgi:hypothetical protein